MKIVSESFACAGREKGSCTSIFSLVITTGRHSPFLNTKRELTITALDLPTEVINLRWKLDELAKNVHEKNLSDQKTNTDVKGIQDTLEINIGADGILTHLQTKHLIEDLNAALRDVKVSEDSVRNQELQRYDGMMY
jgi:hypothetical protein